MNDEKRAEEIELAKQNVEDGTEKLKRLHYEVIMMRRVAIVMQKEFKAANHPDMIVLRKLAQDKQLEFEAFNAQFLAMVDELKKLEGK